MYMTLRQALPLRQLGAQTLKLHVPYNGMWYDNSSMHDTINTRLVLKPVPGSDGCGGLSGVHASLLASYTALFSAARCRRHATEPLQYSTHTVLLMDTLFSCNRLFNYFLLTTKRIVETLRNGGSNFGLNIYIGTQKVWAIVSSSTGNATVHGQQLHSSASAQFTGGFFFLRNIQRVTRLTAEEADYSARAAAALETQHRRHCHCRDFLHHHPRPPRRHHQ